MIHSSKLYQSNKESGTAWLGKVPAHWEILPNRALFSEVKDRDHPDEPMLSVTITRGVIPQRTLLEDTSKKDGSNLDRFAYKLVQPGDIAYNKMRAWQGAIGLSELRGIISPAYVVQRPRSKHANRYFHFLFRTPQFAKEAERWSYGITSDMWSLRPEHFRMIYTPLPPQQEREAIVRFLDHYDRLIRRSIASKRKLIALLNEQNRAIIHRALTHGLDHPSGSKSSSPPKHWKFARLGRMIHLTTGYPFKSSGFTQNTDDIRLLRGINIAPGHIRWDATVRWPASQRGDFHFFELRPGDIVLGMDRPVIAGGVRVSVISTADLPALLLQRVACLRPHPELNAAFLLLLLGSKLFSDYLAPIFTGISVPHLSPQQVRDFTFQLPNMDEQRLIVESVSRTTADLRTAIARAEKEIELLLEYRVRLISDVVLGKLDVREVSQTLPALQDQVSDDELDDEELEDSPTDAEDANDQLTEQYVD